MDLHPDMGATAAVADTEYLSYGFWLKRTTDAMGAITYNEIETFAMATGYGPNTDADIGEINGSATYSGGSVGVYVMTSGEDATSGHYMADVTLDATFGSTGSLGANDLYAIGGEVNNFVLSGGEENDWMVTLGLADLSGRADPGVPGMSPPGTTYTRTFTGVATGDAAAAGGTWNGEFHGLAGDAVDHDDDGATPTIDDVLPGAVTGEFNANFTDGTCGRGLRREEAVELTTAGSGSPHGNLGLHE